MSDNKKDTMTDNKDLLTQQYDSSPYPYIPIEKSPDKDYNTLFINNLTTSYYLYRQKVIDTTDKIILDVGCGSGWTTLQLAVANPKAKIIAIDLSKKSVDYAYKRLKHHNFNNVECHHISIENIDQLNYQYDYMNCSDVIYICENPLEILQKLKTVLKPEGIINANFHSYYQRFHFYQAQQLFKNIGLMDDNPDNFEVEVVADTIKNLSNNTLLKQKVGGMFNVPNLDLTDKKTKQNVLMNFLLQNDKGYTIPEVFEMLRNTQLDFLSMTNWRHWEIRDLFQDKNNIPTTWEFVLENTSQEEQLHLFELLNPCHRLIDLWAVHENSISSSIKPVINWSENEWFNSKIYLHPQLKSMDVKEDLLKVIQQQDVWEISKYIKVTTANPVYLTSGIAAVLVLLWDKAQSFGDLVNYWLAIQPKNLLNGEDKTREEATQEIKDLVIKLETFLYLLVELV